MRWRCKLSREQVDEVVARLRAGGSSITAEAFRVEVYHQTLRKTIRKVIGRDEYDRLPLRRCQSQRPLQNVMGAQSETTGDQE